MLSSLCVILSALFLLREIFFCPIGQPHENYGYGAGGQEKNENPVFEGRYALISANDSKPIYVVLTDETDQMIYRAQTVLAAEAE